MVGVAFAVNFVAVGFHFYSFGVFFKAIANELEGSRFGISMAMAISMLAGSLIAPFVGRALDSSSIRHLMIGGAVSVSLAFGLLSRITALWQLYLVLGTFLAFGMSLLGGVASSKLVSNWFVARRGTALGIAGIGMSVSGMLMPGVTTWLIEQVGWRGAYALFAVASAILVIPAVALIVIDRPEDVGEAPDGEPPPSAGGIARLPEIGVHTRDVLRSRKFWAIAAPFGLALGAFNAFMSHLVPFADDIGIPAYRAAGVVSLAAGAGLIGKLLFGWLYDRFDPRMAVWGSLGLQALGLSMLLATPDLKRLMAAALVFGLGMGALIPLHAALAASAFGRVSFGKVMGLLRPAGMPLQAAGVPLVGLIFDMTGSYTLAFQLLICAYAVAALMIATLDLRT